MFKFVTIAALCFVGVLAKPQGYGHQHGHHEVEHHEHAPAHYAFEYAVHDGHTGDVKEQKEDRKGDHVEGYYTLVQPDGRRRIVHYTSDKHVGFQAHVQYEGKAIHQEPQHHAAPVHHAIHVAPVHHVAPVVHQSHHIPIVQHHVQPVFQHQGHHDSHHGATSHISNSGPIHNYEHHH